MKVARQDGRSRRLPVIGMFIVAMTVTSCHVPRNRERAIQNAIEQVKETMRVALPDLPHPEPYKYQGQGDCVLVPGWNSSKESLRYQVEVTLPPGDDGLERQTRAVKHWVEKGGTIRELPYPTGPASEVDYQGGRIMAYAYNREGERNEKSDQAQFWIVATTPCVPKID